MSDTEKATGTATPAPDGTFKTVTLETPLVRGEKTFTQITLRKPKAGELRGLKIGELMASDVSASLKLLPRISEPILTETECDNLDPADLFELVGALSDFFMTTADRAARDQMIAEARSKM